MLKINRRTDYAIRVLIALAKSAPGERLPTRHIQEEMSIPLSFLQRIVSELSQAGIILTNPGPSGGLQLARPSEEITLKDIYILVEGNFCISECLNNRLVCPLSPDCPVRSRWGRLHAMIQQELSHTTIAQLAREAMESRALAVSEEQTAYEPHAYAQV